MTTDLHVALADGELRLEPLVEGHREGLRAACAADPDIWQISSVSMVGDRFGASFDALRDRAAYAIFNAETLVGCTSWYDHDPANKTVAIGFTYITPQVRGDGFNLRLKRLMINHARACGIVRIVFDIDVRNTRSQAAVRKLGARLDGVLRAHKITWTGHVRDTAVFSLLPGEESDLLRGP
jgi:RimJ/RimL family protein N-acetyltransferase